MKKNNYTKDILSLDEILNQTETPDFLKKQSKLTANFLNEPQEQPEKQLKVNPVIEKNAKVNIERAKEIKDTQQNLQNFKQYLELTKFANHVGKPKKSQQKNNQAAYEQLQKKSKNILKKKPQSVKEKEKQRRMKGQSSISTWKTEDEMKLRQQFD